MVRTSPRPFRRVGLGPLGEELLVVARAASPDRGRPARRTAGRRRPGGWRRFTVSPYRSPSSSTTWPWARPTRTLGSTSSASQAPTRPSAALAADLWRTGGEQHPVAQALDDAGAAGGDVLGGDALEAAEQVGQLGVAEVAGLAGEADQVAEADDLVHAGAQQVAPDGGHQVPPPHVGHERLEAGHQQVGDDVEVLGARSPSDASSSVTSTSPAWNAWAWAVATRDRAWPSTRVMGMMAASAS